MKTILAEYKIHNADVSLRYDATTEDLIDVIEGNRVYVPCIFVLNKIDQISVEVSAKICLVYVFPGRSFKLVGIFYFQYFVCFFF